ncbi:MAG: flagellar biosynthetic protein FliO [bacterium]|nr:flagellar biosynthetic protein FliO [bacterium]
MTDSIAVVDTVRTLLTPPATAGGVSLGMAVLKLSIGLLFIVILIWVMVWVLKRTNTLGQVGGNLQLLEYKPLGPKKGVALFRAANKIVLLGVTDQNIEKLTEWVDPTEVAEILAKKTVEPQPSFRSILTRKTT